MNDNGEISRTLFIPGPSVDLSQLELIHSGPRHKLYRASASGVGIVVKAATETLPSAAAVASLRHEYELLRELKLPGIIRVVGLGAAGNTQALFMEDAGDTNLAAFIRSQSLSLADFLNIAIQLAEAVARLHGAGIVHRDIHPGNIVWNSERAVATLCDFAIARTLPTLATESLNSNHFAGSLPYMSPEQTGRTGRSVDWRVDLYSLGATFFEMLTGTPPFTERDVLAQAHAQIARPTRPPHEINSQVPLTLSRIVLKLLEKEPERRYQSAKALMDDLRQAEEQWLQSAKIEPFPLGSREVPRGLNIPDNLYGRDEELESLAGAFARTRAGGRELVLVTGGPGIGKSALVDRLRQSVADRGGLYAAGKFDQLQRSVPFSGLAQALRSLVRQLLAESETVLDGWRKHIEEAVAPNGQLLMAITPELEQLLGPQPPVLEVGPVESRNRFNLVVTRFLRVFARPEHPFVLFLDDLQWVDAASLQLLEQWVSDAASHHLLVIGAYRDNEVGLSHPLAFSLSALREAGCQISTIHLKPLGSGAIAQLAADTFSDSAERMQFLAGLIIRKSAGNPFFVRRLLHLMYAQGLFRFLSDSQRWTWDESEIESAPISDNVLDLMVLAIDRLPPEARRLLKTGACIGHQFELSTLAELTDLSLKAVTEQLWPAIEDGLLVSMDDTYNPSSLNNSAIPLQPNLRFAHDRVQQAAYGLLSEHDRQALHHAIGRRLLDRAGDNLDQHLFEIVDQFDLGQANVIDDAERRSLVDLNLAAGRKAQASAAYRAAFEYLTVARRYLGDGAWDHRPELTFTVHRELAESAYLAGEHATAEELVEISLEHAPSKIAKADLYGLRVLAATVASDWPRALHWGREGLSVFGLEWPLEGLAEVIKAEADAVMKNLGEREIEKLIDVPDVEDADIRAGMRLLSLLGAPAYFSGSPVLPFLVARAVNLSLIHGPSLYSSFAYVFFGGIHNALTGQYDIGYAFGKLALAMAKRFRNRAEECRTVEVYGVLVHHWKAPLREGLPMLKEGFRAGVESGETAFAAFCLNSVLINALPAGMPLNELLEEAEVALDFATTQKNKTSVEIAIPQRQIARALTGATSRPDVFDDQEFAETRFLAEAGNHETALGHYWVAKLQLAYLMGDYEGAFKYSREAEKRVPTGILGMITSAEHVFYTALATAAVATLSTSESSSSFDQLRALHGKLINWAKHCPQNFAHKASLVGAEIARLAGASSEAMRLYRSAIDEAERQKFIQDEALAHELRARFLLSEHESALAAVHFRSARECYRRWGATVKVSALEREHPDCFASELRAPLQGVSIDAIALIKASQAISAETQPEKVFERILRIVVEVAGAQRAALVLSVNGRLMVRARIEATEEFSVSLEEVPLAEYPGLSPAILRYVMRTKEVLLLADASADGIFASYPVVQQRGLRSVLCAPLFKQGTVVGLLYLENNAMAGAFANELIEVVQVLASQAAISLENSTLLEELQMLTGSLEERVVERTRQLTDEITARDKAETALRESEKRLRALVNASSDVIYRMSPDWSKMWRLEGRDFIADTLEPREHWIDAYIHPDDQATVRKAIRHAIEKKTTFELEHRVLRVDGTLGWTLSRAVPVLDDEGNILEWFGAASDFTARKETEQALRTTERLASVGRLAATVAHEINNPLEAVTNLVYLAKGGTVSDDVKEYLNAIDEELARIAHITKQTLGFYRESTAPSLVHVEPMLDSAISVFNTRALSKGIQIHKEVRQDPEIFAIAGEIRQLIANLLSNGIDAVNSNGAIRIRVGAIRRDGQYSSGIRITIADSGPGIPASVRPRLFEPFFTTKEAVGTGLGLWVCSNIVDRHHGSIHVKSSTNPKKSWTVFSIFLPARQELANEQLRKEYDSTDRD